MDSKAPPYPNAPGFIPVPNPPQQAGYPHPPTQQSYAHPPPPPPYDANSNMIPPTGHQHHQQQHATYVHMATWRPARTRMVCPNCGECRFPTIRSTADRYSQSIYGATWIMTCWPFCFLPCLFTAPTKHHLHCSNCNAYLGLYDPNREVVGRNQHESRVSSGMSTVCCEDAKRGGGRLDNERNR